MKELIERLRSLQSSLQKGWFYANSDAALVQEAITALESMPAWVKCEERLPKHGSFMIFDGEEVGEGFYTEERGWRWTTGVPAKALQWSEMPAPPIEQEA